MSMIKGEKIKLGKRFVALTVILIVIISISAGVIYKNFSKYREGQKIAVNAIILTNEVYQIQSQNPDISYSQLVWNMYWDYLSRENNPRTWRFDMTEADLALGKLLSASGYPTRYGTEYLKYNTVSRFINDQSKYAFMVYGELGAVLLLIIFYLIYFIDSRKNMEISSDTITCKKGNKVVKQIPIDEVKAVNLISKKGIRIKGNGLNYKLNSVKNAEELKKAIMDKISCTECENNVTRIQSEAELLKKYKDLLDSGIISQEEFEAKKKEILKL